MMAKKYAPALIDFIRKSPTAFHAAENICKTLTGFESLEEGKPWKLVPGGRYYVTRNRSSVIAFTVPENTPTAFQLIASHADSPMFKIKENAETYVGEQYVRLDTERYGGMILASWLDRPLSVAGRCVVKDRNAVRTVLVDLDRDAVLIPNLAIHMNREINDGFKFNAAVDTMPLWGNGKTKNTFRAQIADACGVKQEDLLGTDLFLYNRTAGTVWGPEGEFVSAPRLDDLECVFASIQALKAVKKSQHINVCCVFDNEEVGSRTRQGADSDFLENLIHRINDNLKRSSEEYYTAYANSFMISADNAHALHPAHKEKYDPVQSPKMNEGIVLKFSARQSYTTDGISAAFVRKLCEDSNIPYQVFVNHSDEPGGSTLGNISNSHVSVNTADIGLPQLAMHSSYEVAGIKDIEYLREFAKAYYQ